jgi:hypothetical protein
VRTTKDQPVAAGHGMAPARWQPFPDELLGRIAGRFTRVESRRRPVRSCSGCWPTCPRKTCWSIAEHAGDHSPDGMQHLLSLASQEADLLAREWEVAAQGEQLVQVSTIAQSMTQLLEQLRVGLDQAGFQQRRQPVELLIGRVVVTDGRVEIRYVIPTTDNSTKTRFCHLRTDHFHLVASAVGRPVEAGLAGPVR